MRNNKNFLDTELLWEIPLAFLSLVFFKTVRLLIRTIAYINAKFNKKIFFRWLVYSDKILKRPLILPSILVTGPRWNPHAIAAGAGPFDIRESLDIEVKSCIDSAKSWTIGIYRFPDAKIIKHIGSNSSNFQEQWYKLKLIPGKYTLGIRYYDWSDEVNLPAINVDGLEIITNQSINSNDVNNYLNNLIERDNIFYRCLNGYIFTLLICEKWLPKKWVMKEYLPVGDTNNDFFYGVIYKGCSLKIEINSLLLNNYDVYLTIYNRSSFPVVWYQIKEEKHTTCTVEKDGFYLIRVRSNLSSEVKNILHDHSEVIPSKETLIINMQKH
ncbi:DUF6208 family protein [Umezakia ovalisporum]|uniref:DUF6208 family protein n=1 Tax=Umezakia ovalisporum FSS-43 TaxID=2740520 RepID=A0ABT6K8B4_9CYAN|nr:DUF6208 family protein [Umezakia ovalisporum]MDH6058601.1 DUF6208 family protein [Umezakia ovalisporum FSS-43]MDH6069524.1 DUF6208 family protein [Umezakia ovalisporum CobakiLakeA]MDH6075348.1 DUF6208 family protein [Umezakia ovalisporum CS-1034]MDH6082724.1 DUF6208 family protein [Umezakia ovalisporum FSS-44]MDH6096909.1 DUF6208 family protein [Umezakia ovalisporum CobakiLakeB]